ncbi:Bifunctional chorismate mutase/prephenate dehydratase [Buchnera aphidicola (Takecallis arundicolens)]|uniref:chorismate mutase n=1 Tax=Buchnera aphidicola TaxID=9 RepID=UPI0034640085
MELKKILLNLRNTINEIDELILNLLSKRRKIAIKIAKKKIANNFPIKDQNRENELLQKLLHIGKLYQLPEKYIQKIFQIIIQDSVMIQQQIKIQLNQKNNFKKKIFSCLGPYGSYSYIISTKFTTQYYKNYIIKEYNNFQDIFVSIENNQSHYAIVPIENSTSGFIYEVYHLLCSKKLTIVGECYLPIKNCLLVKPGTKFKEINHVYSHNQVFKQCSIFITKFPNWNTQYTHSTAQAMQIVSQNNNNNTAAIGNKNSAKFYKLHPILKQISNIKNNNTRFFILTKNNILISDITSNKITVLLKTKEMILFKIILLLYSQNIPIIQLESNLDYQNNIKEIIYLEIQAHIKDSRIQKILKILKKKDISIQILGCYPVFNIL